MTTPTTMAQLQTILDRLSSTGPEAVNALDGERPQNLEAYDLGSYARTAKWMAARGVDGADELADAARQLKEAARLYKAAEAAMEKALAAASEAEHKAEGWANDVEIAIEEAAEAAE